MNKAQLVRKAAEVTGLTQISVETTLTALLEIIADNIDEGVKLVDFGTFSVTTRKPRMGRNPKDNTPIPIPARRMPVFRAGEGLKKKCLAKRTSQ